MGFIKVDKFRSFLSSHPPLVVFIFCIGMTAVAFVSFAYYIKFNNVKNVDVQKDWNTILNNATKVDFCETSYLSTDLSHLNTSYLSTHRYINVSLQLDIVLNLPSQFKRMQPATTFVSNFNSSLFGYTGHLSRSAMYLTFDLFNPTKLICERSEGCLISQTACVTITAPQDIFPPLKPWPASCSVHPNTTFPPLAFTASMSDDGEEPCSSVLMKITHEEDERLFVYLTLETKSLVHEHLMRSSYFLFIVIVVILLFGFLRGAHQHHEKKPTHGYV